MTSAPTRVRRDRAIDAGFDADTFVDDLPAGVTACEAVAVDRPRRIAVKREDATHWRRGRGAIPTPVAGR